MREDIHIGTKLGPKLGIKICINDESKVRKFRLDIHLPSEIKWYEINVQILHLNKLRVRSINIY